MRCWDEGGEKSRASLEGGFQSGGALHQIGPRKHRMAGEAPTRDNQLPDTDSLSSVTSDTNLRADRVLSRHLPCRPSTCLSP